MTQDASCVPVIVGVGQVNDRPADPAQGMDPLQLMQAALLAAEQDAGGGWLSRLDSLAVVSQISFPALGDLSARVADGVGATPRLCTQTPTPSGDSPILLLNEAAVRVAAGAVRVAAVVGGEALRTAAARAASAAHDATRAASARHAPHRSARYGLVAPVDVYPLYENASRAAYGQTLAQGQAETGEIWSRFSDVAADNPGAWLRKRVPAATICTASAENRPIAFPYTKLMVANASVNQGAGFLVTSLSLARAHGLPERRLVYVGRGAAAHEPADFLARDCYARSAGMAVSLRRALSGNGLSADELDFVELYSCFPCVPKMARRVIGWQLDRPATVFGGLTFGGGPIGNAMSHAVAAMVEKLREGGRAGLLFGNGGFATHNHSIVLGRERPEPARRHPTFDCQAEADAERGPVPGFVQDYTGRGTIETYTVFHERDGGVRFGVVVGSTPSGHRFLAKVAGSDHATIAMLTDGLREPVGSGGVAVAIGDEAHWRPD